MPALSSGTQAPDFQLPDMQNSQFSLERAVERGPVVLAFFKISCPVCQYAMPFLERIYQAHQGGANIIGISQNSRRDTAAFLKEYGITFPVLLDDSRHYPVSNAYGLTNVPTVFLVAPGREIEISSVGWNKKDIEAIHRRLAEKIPSLPPQLFQPGEQVIDYKAG